MNDNKQYFSKVTVEDFNCFKRELLANDETSIYKYISLQKFSFIQTKQMLEHGKDVLGNPYTEEELNYLKLILNQIENNYKNLKAEYDQQEQA